MFMCTRRLRVPKDHNPLQGFLCNRNVDLLTRLQGLAKRLRLRSKLYNGRQRVPQIEENRQDTQTFAKIHEDDVDYDRVTRELLGELLTKFTFLSNRECILILDLLGRIKKPLHRCRTEQENGENDGENVQKTDATSLSVDGVDTTPVCRSTVNHLAISGKYGAIANDKLVRFVVKAQRMLLNHMLKAHEQKVLTKAQKYYLICLLSRECSLASVELWASLMDELKRDLELREDYLPFERANLLLVYDQICRWVGKRLSKAAKHAATSEVIGHPHQDGKHVGNTHINPHLDPFDPEFFDMALSKLEPMLSQLTPEKAIKLLYLQHSRRIYSKSFIQSAAMCLAVMEWSNVKSFKLYISAIGIYHKISTANLWNEFNSVYTSHGGNTELLNDGSPMLHIVNIKPFEVEPWIESQGVNSLQLKAINELAECSSFSLMSLIMTYTLKLYRSYGIEHSGCAGLEDHINRHSFGSDALKEILLRCMKQDTSHNVPHSLVDEVSGMIRMEGIVEIVLGHVYFNHCVLVHLSQDQEYDHIRQRSQLNLHILYETIHKSIDLQSHLLSKARLDHRNAEPRLIAKVRNALKELLKLDADLCGYHDVLKGLLSKLDAMDRQLDDSC
ncbi:21 kDa hemolysin precursor, putative [Babesia ovata]|uniref:21 kDa hemolysin, putative n=1 Tax=Babesia ovata TaxID=189622 RepID=A0A2H6KGJ7_9APIC|nr:21 kDa hemolysin precursor, putative [Babesia ovata]GBE62115.1 21 kDa hemolysin precursor, putative [Babesia ovata]